MPGLFDRIFPDPIRVSYDTGTAFTLMSLNAIVYLDITPFAARLRDIFKCDSITQVASTGQFVPAFLVLRKGKRVILVLEGTRGIQGWWNYVRGASGSPLGPAPGRVFSPFAVLVRSVQPNVIAQVAQDDWLMFTGHSLGAAVAAVLNSLMTQAGWTTLPAWCFATPRFGDAAFCAAARGTAVNANLPNDPVPLLPPDPITAIETEPAILRWVEVFRYLGGAVTLTASQLATQGPEALDWVVALAAANIVPSRSPHNSYQYILSTIAGLSKPYPSDIAALGALLIELGLTQPWPS